MYNKAFLTNIERGQKKGKTGGIIQNRETLKERDRLKERLKERPKWKTTQMEDDPNGRRPKWKTTQM